MTAFSDLTTRSHLGRLIITSDPGPNTVYLDNLYFYEGDTTAATQVVTAPATTEPAAVTPVSTRPGIVAATAAEPSGLVRVVSDESGDRLQVNGRDFMVLGINWDYFPIGENYAYSLWSQPDDFIEAALAREMPMLKAMGINALRIYTGIPPRWVRHIYERYGIWTVLNHSFGRYGVTIDGVYIPTTDYSDPRVREQLVSEVRTMVEEFRDVPGVLMWLLGNENNYGLFWGGAETEDLPEGVTKEMVRARHMYSVFNDGINAIKELDSDHPVAIANGDLLFIDIIAEEIENLDIFGANVYRGITFTDLFDEVKAKLDIPVFFTEFGADAWDAKEMREDQVTQARYLLGQWQAIYEHSAGKGTIGNAIGGLTFQWSDGWWKYGQEINLDVHDINASWANDAYREDFVPGDNNMNEEWWGICAKGPTDSRGLFELYPRAAYYALQRAYTLDPYAPTTDLVAINRHFRNIEPMQAMLTARGDKAALITEELKRVRVSGVRAEFETISTGGSRVVTPENPDDDYEGNPAFQGFDHLQSYYAKLEARPAGNVHGSVTLNYLGHVPENPIDEIFYENRGLSKKIATPGDGEQIVGEPLQVDDIERLKVYQANLSWDDRWFTLDAFYRTNHYHWGYEGDFFGLYQEASYGPNIDIYNGEAPLGFEMAFKRDLHGLKLALGPELWWGANPAMLLKYQQQVGRIEATAIYQEDLDEQGAAVSSNAIPLPPTRKVTLHLATEQGPFGIEIGGIWSGENKVGETFQIVDGSPGDYRVLEDEIKASDAFGGKAKLTYQKGRWNWYAQGAVMGLVADGGYTQTLTYTGWRLKDVGKGNQYNVITGLAVNLGSWQVAPNFLWQKPIEGPIPSDVPAPGRPRNILDDPFAVRENRETTAGELLITFDPTPATWMWAWDSDVREDARLAASIGFVFKHHPTTQDAAIGIMADGRTTFPFPGAPPARDLWEAHARIVSKVRPGLGVITNLYAGKGEPNGDDERTVNRLGGDVRITAGQFKFGGFAKINDWGPYDYHRDFNNTFPLQFMGDLSYVLGAPDWFDVPQTRIGVQAKWRSLDRYSPRYCPTTLLDPSGELVCDPEAEGFSDGNEWEIRTYLHLSVGL
ncbi:glycosidase [bacterium]|nr:glycosidase [bacterium]